MVCCWMALLSVSSSPRRTAGQETRKTSPTPAPTIIEYWTDVPTLGSGEQLGVAVTSDAPSDVPSDAPSLVPTSHKSDMPSTIPSDVPSMWKSDDSSFIPSMLPTIVEERQGNVVVDQHQQRQPSSSSTTIQDAGFQKDEPSQPGSPTTLRISFTPALVAVVGAAGLLSVLAVLLFCLLRRQLARQRRIQGRFKERNEIILKEEQEEHMSVTQSARDEEEFCCDHIQSDSSETDLVPVWSFDA